METWKLNKLHLFPIFYVLWLITGMMICFWLAHSKGHVSIYVPFISETGGKLPESGIFTFFLCIGAFLGFFIMLIRYLIIYKLNSQRSKKIDVLNKIALFIGCISLCGMIIVGSYPVYGSLEIHMTAAKLLFYSGVLYGFFQMLITLLMQPRIYKNRIFLIRLAISVFAFAFLIGMIKAIQKGKSQWKSTYPIAKKMPGDEGFALILTSTICEWMMVICFFCFFLSFITDFQMFKINISIYEDRPPERNLKILRTPNRQNEQLKRKGTKKDK